MSDDQRSDGANADSRFEQLLQDVAHAPAVARMPVSAVQIEAAFHGHPRFQLRRRLGEGGFGTVFEAEDRQRGGQVALKVLHRSDGQALYRFKQEFRALAGLSHPNLVALYELFTGDELWFFTMERVAGADFLHYVNAAPDAGTRAERHGDPTLRGHVLGLRALICTVKGRFAESLALSERAEALFVSVDANTARRLAEMHNHRQYCLFVLGHWRRLVQGYTERVDEYRRRGDRFAEITLGANFGWLGPLMADDPAAASALIDELMGRWSQRGFHLQHFNALLARAHIDVYAGRGMAALERLDTLWPEVQRSGLLHIKSLRFRAMTARCRAALAAIEERQLQRRAPSEARQLLARVERDLARQAKIPAPLGRAMVKVLRAGHARLLGQREQAITWLAAAEAEMEALGARGPQVFVRYRRGELLGGEVGDRLLAETGAYFQAEGVRVPARLIAAWG